MYECYLCGVKARATEHLIEDEYGDEVVLVPPQGWSKDGRDRDRCPKHRENAPIATLGDVLRAKLQGGRLGE